MNRTLLTLNLGGNKITDVGTKFLSEILTNLTLTHDEIVARRKLISENKSSLANEDVSENNHINLDLHSCFKIKS